MFDELDNEKINEIIKNIYSKYNVPPIKSKNSFKRLEQIAYFLKWYSEKIQKEACLMYSLKIKQEDIIAAQKLYLIYPYKPPYMLLKLSWSQIKIIIKIYNKSKRDFYITCANLLQWNTSTLEKYIKNDFYEKYCFLKKKYKRYKDKDLISKLIEIYDVVYEID